jgi:hypothetical protein
VWPPEGGGWQSAEKEDSGWGLECRAGGGVWSPSGAARGTDRWMRGRSTPPHWAPTLPLPFDRGDQEARPPSSSPSPPSSSPSHSPLGSLDVMRPLFLSLSLAGQRPWPCADGRPRPLFGACCCPLPAHAARGRPSSNCLRPMVGSCCYSIPCCFSLGRPPIIA